MVSCVSLSLFKTSVEPTDSSWYICLAKTVLNPPKWPVPSSVGGTCLVCPLRVSEWHVLNIFITIQICVFGNNSREFSGSKKRQSDSLRPAIFNHKMLTFRFVGNALANKFF